MAQKNAPLRLRFDEGELTVSAQTPDVGEASPSRCPCRSPASRSRSGSTRSSCATAWTASAREDLILKLISPLRPGLIEGADESGFLYLIMPIRLNV